MLQRRVLLYMEIATAPRATERAMLQENVELCVESLTTSSGYRPRARWEVCPVHPGGLTEFIRTWTAILDGCPFGPSDCSTWTIRNVAMGTSME